MKILMVNKFLYPNGGSETYIFQLGDELQKQGHAVQYFGMEHEGRIVGNHAESYTAGMDFHTGTLQKLLYPFKIIYSREARIKIRRVLEDFKPDAVHLNNFNFQLTPSIIYEIRKYAKQTEQNVKIVFTAHDYQLVCPNHMMNVPSSGENCERCLQAGFGQCIKYRCIHNSKIKSLLGTVEAKLYRILHTYRLLDTIICPTNFMKNKLDQSPDLAGRTVVLYNFVQPVVQTAESKKDYVLYFGRYAREKGVETLLEVCRKLPEISFVFAGSGPLEKLVNQSQNVENRGFLTGEELTRTIREARFCVYPSEWYENCPFSVMEAQMYGTPVVGADIGGIPELIADHKTGLLFESGNKEQLIEIIRDLWNNPEKNDILAGECIKPHFDTVETYADKIMKIYQ